ncbi:hypothetical protein OG948_34405 (plasmid) [Embleya sp. NBC_00888]|uniref:hypothetical protein n=1 Tax=Embleya sp. NBC_00888 TaxID=2975960 RepID=UPI002F90E6AF|nr:hypothetical protein OG948_34405 [Embleya sp. NBC_00888]
MEHLRAPAPRAGARLPRLPTGRVPPHRRSGAAVHLRRCGSSNTLEQPRWKPARNEPTWFYELHPAITESIAEDGNHDLLATRFLRSKAWAGACLVTEEFKLVQDGKAVVGFDFAATTVEGLFLGESKKNDCLADSAKATLTELDKLLNGCRALGRRTWSWPPPRAPGSRRPSTSNSEATQRTAPAAPNHYSWQAWGTDPKITTLDGKPFTMD